MYANSNSMHESRGIKNMMGGLSLLSDFLDVSETLIFLNHPGCTTEPSQSNDLILIQTQQQTINLFN
jgi:hypothetical protein